MLDALLGMAAVFAKEKAPDAMLGALGSLASLLGEPIKRGLTRVRDRHFGAPRPAAAHLQQAVWVAFHAAIAERLESACKELDDAILVASVDRDPTDLTELSRRREAFADIRKHADAAASEMAARLDDPAAEPPDWTSALLTELPGYIVWPPQEAVVRSSLDTATEAALRGLALRRVRALNPLNDIDHASLAALFQRHDGPGDWLAAYARQFSQLVATRDGVWRPLVTARVEALAEELRLTIARTAEVEREAILLAIQRIGLTEPRQWLHRVETVRRELRGQGERTETRVFAGRAVEMAALDAWFDGGGSDRHLVVGRSGVGKSVLIQHWTDRKALDPAVTVLHVPLVSSPIDTADEERALRYVCARLCALGEPPAMPLATATLDDLGDTLETLLADFGGRQILIAIDGLDELTDPKDFVRCLPTSLPSGTKLLLSARAMAGGQDAKAWIAQLGLAEIPDQVTYLEPLGRRALREALAQAGHAPNGPTFEYLVSRVTQLTDGGDPLLFAFLSADAGYLQSLTADPTDAEDTGAWRSGYRKLLERWIDDAASGMQAGGVGQDQRQMCFAALVAVAAAPAPPGDGELLQVLRRRCDPRLLTMKGVLAPVRRWLTGDGRSGYRFSHPRLAEVVMTPHVLMDEPTLVHVGSAFGEWFEEETTRGAAGATMPQYVARHALSYLLEHPSSVEDPVTRHVTGPMLRACRRSGVLLDAVGGARKHLAHDAWQGVGGMTPSASVLVVRLLRLGLFLGSAPRGLTHGSAAVLTRAVTIGALSSAEASAWALQGDDRQLFDHAYPEEQGWSQVHIEPEAYHLPVLYGSLDEATRDELRQVLSRRRDEDQISREGAEFPDEYWAWFGTLLLRMAAERPALCDDAESYLASLPSWRAARCMLYVASLLPQRPDWFADMARRVRSATTLHAESAGTNFDEEVAWLKLAHESVDDHADRLLSLLDNWRTMTAWPMRTGSVFSPSRMRMRRLAELTRHSAAAREQGLALLASEHPFSSVEWAELAQSLGTNDVAVQEAIEAGRSVKREGRPDPSGVVVARFCGTLAAMEDTDWPHFKQWPQWAEGLKPRDVVGLPTDRLQDLERAAASLKPYARTQALCALAAVSDDVVRRLVVEWQSSYRWLYHDNIVAQALGRASPQARRRLLASLRDHASSIADTSDAVAFAGVAASGDTVDRELLLDLVRALPDGTLRAHLAWHVAQADPALHPAAGTALGEARGTAAQLVRAAWAGKRWAAWPGDVEWTSPESAMRDLLVDVLPQLLAPGFQDDPYIVALLRDEDWLTVLRKTGHDTLIGLIGAPFASEKQDVERRLAMRAAFIARTGDFFDVVERFPELRQSKWACAIGTGLAAEEVPQARAAIEALLEPYGDEPRVLGTSFHGWKLLVHGLVAEHPDSIGWFAALLRRHNGQLNRFDFLPALARPQRADAIEALSAEGVSAGNICLMLLAANDPVTRKVGRGRLAELIRAGSRPPLLGTRYEDDAPFTARALLGGLLAECEDPKALEVAMEGLRLQAVRWYAEPVEASIDISSLVAEVLRRAPDAMAFPLADIVCETMTEYLG